MLTNSPCIKLYDQEDTDFFFPQTPLRRCWLYGLSCAGTSSTKPVLGAEEALSRQMSTADIDTATYRTPIAQPLGGGKALLELGSREGAKVPSGVRVQVSEQYVRRLATAASSPQTIIA